MRLIPTFFIFSFVFLICGCSSPPTTQTIIGSWVSTDKIYTLDFYMDGTFTFSKVEANPTSISDMINKLGFSMIAPSGAWSLNGSELDVSCAAANGIPMVLKIVSWSDNTLVLRFGNGDAVSFVRKQPNNKEVNAENQKL